MRTSANLASRVGSQGALEAFIELISDSEFQPGSKLPSERKLSAEWGMSRPSLREALAVLEILGLVEILPGKGTFLLTKQVPLEMVTSAMDIMNDTDTPAMVMESREAFEPEAVALAAIHATPNDIDELEQILREMEGISFEKVTQWANLDYEFHKRIAIASRNQIVIQTMDTILDLWFSKNSYWNSLKQRAYTSHEHTKSFGILHRNILENIARHDVDGARQAAREHNAMIEEAFQSLRI
jgi:DNA-binding FadR family transcriptional regulator